MHITVVGIGRFAQPPELGTLTVTAGFESADQGEALARTTELIAQLTERVRRLEAQDPSPITTCRVLPIQTQTWRPYADSGEVMPERHSASARMLVTFRDLAALSGFVDEVGGVAGVTLVGVDWSLTEATRDRTEAAVLAEAVARARSRATIVAHAAGALDVQFREIADPGLLGAGPAQEQVFAAFAREARDEAGIELAPEDIVTTATLHVRFEAT